MEQTPEDTMPEQPDTPDTPEQAEQTEQAEQVEPQVEAPQTVTLSQGQYDDLVAGATAGAAALAALDSQRRDGIIATALTEGRLRPVDADAWRTALDTDEAGTVTLLGTLPQVLPTTVLGSAHASNERQPRQSSQQPASDSGRIDPRRLREYADAILYVLRTGCPWRHLPHDFEVEWSAAHQQFMRWTRRGVWDQALVALREQCRLSDGRKAAATGAVVDSSSVKASPVPGERG